jgi:translocation and assembly module TamB
MKRFPLVVSGQRLAILSGKTEKWTGQFDWQHAAMNVRLQELLAELPPTSSKTLQPLEQNPEIAIVSKNETKKKAKVVNAHVLKEPPTKSAFEASIRIQAPRAITIKSDDARIELGADLQLDLGNKTVLVGNAELFPDISRGGTGQSRVDVMSRTFAIDSGKVTWFSGGEPDNPQLNIQAVFKEPREQVEVTVRVLGTGLKPRIELSSEPTLDETAIATLLATGRTKLKRGSGQIAFGDDAASVVSAFASDRLRKTIANVMPLNIFQPDVLQVELDQSGGYQSARVGKYVTDDLFVGYHNNNNSSSSNAQQEKGENSNEVRVEYQLTPKITLESQYGDANRGGVDMVVTHDY